MKTLHTSTRLTERPAFNAGDSFGVRSVMPGSVIVPGLRYSIPLHAGRGARRNAESLDPDFNRPETRHVLSGQRI